MCFGFIWCFCVQQSQLFLLGRLSQLAVGCVECSAPSYCTVTVASVMLYFTVTVACVKSYFTVTVASVMLYFTVTVASVKSNFTIHSLRVPKLRKYKSEENTESQINNNSLAYTCINLFKSYFCWFQKRHLFVDMSYFRL